jgi:thiosulfate dehydrogenase [quinone] large subunit
MTGTTTAPHGPYSGFQTTTLVVLRMLIGWHFCYEGLAKLLNPYWTSAGYLAGSQWFLKDELIKIAASPTAVTVIDLLNQWGLVAIGLGLMFGLLARPAAIAGVTLLALYWIVAPPFATVTYPIPAEGSYVLVNKVLVELGALLVILAFPTSRTWGLDRFLFPARAATPAAAPGD